MKKLRPGARPWPGLPVLALLLVSLAAAAADLFPEPALASAPDPNTSKVYIVVDTALADGRDAVELEVVLFSPASGLLGDATVFGASSRAGDSVSTGSNEDGLVTVEVTSDTPGVAQIALSVVSQDAAARFLAGEIGAYEAGVIQTDRGEESFPVYFIAGNLDIEYCLLEFDKDTIAVTDQNYSDNAIGTVYLRTELDLPVANQRITVSSEKSGILLYPARSSNANRGEGSSISLVTESDGTVTFVVRGYETGDAEIIVDVDGQEFGQFIYIDAAENVFEFEEPDWEEYEEEDEEEVLVISRENTDVGVNKNVAYEYGGNSRFGLANTEDSWDKILIGGVAMTADDEPVRDERLVQAYVTAGSLDKNTTLTTSTGGAFSFSLSSRDTCMGYYAVGLGTVDQLKGFLEGSVSADGCQLLGTGMYAFISRDWNQYLICGIDEQRAIINGYSEVLDAAPFVQDGRTMMLARPIANTIGAVSRWDQAAQTASFYDPRGNYTISMQAGSRRIARTEPYVAPRETASDVPAMIRDGRTVLPLRALAEAFGMRTVYDAGQGMVAIYNTAEYDPRRDPSHPQYDPTLDPNSPDYDPTKDPRNLEYDPTAGSVGGSR